MTLRTRIISSLVACAIVIIGLGSFAAFRVSSINNATTAIAARWLPSVDMTARASEDRQLVRQFVLRHALASDAATKTQVEEQLRDYIGRVDGFFPKYRTMIVDPTEKQLVDVLRDKWQAYVDQVEPTLVESRAGRVAEASARILGINSERSKDVSTAFQALKDFIKAGSADEAAKADWLANSTMLIAGVVTCLSALGIAALGVWLVRGVSQPILRTAHVMQRMAEGDLAVVIEGQQRTDEIGHMARALEVFRANAEQARKLEVMQETDRSAKERVRPG